MVELITATNVAGVFRTGTGAGWQYSRTAGSYVQAADWPGAENRR
jgi:hypothetical protein